MDIYGGTTDQRKDPYRVRSLCLSFLSAAGNDTSRGNYTDISGRSGKIPDFPQRRKNRISTGIVLQSSFGSPDLLLIPEKLKSLGNVTDVVDESGRRMILVSSTNATAVL